MKLTLSLSWAGGKKCHFKPTYAVSWFEKQKEEKTKGIRYTMRELFAMVTLHFSFVVTKRLPHKSSIKLSVQQITNAIVTLDTSDS